MEQLIQYFEYPIIKDILMLTVSVLLAVTLFSLKQHRKNNKNQILAIQSLESDLRALANAAIGVGGRVLKVERQLRTSVVAVETLDKQIKPQPAETPIDLYAMSNQPYEQAIRMAQTGVSVEDIMGVCGLSKSEVELVCMMHRLDKAS